MQTKLTGKVKPALSLITITLIPLFPCYAEESVELDEMTITSTRTDTRVEDSPQVVTVINREQIEQQLSFTTDNSQILSNLLPAFTPGRQKLTGAGETFRGRSPLFLIDGVPQSNPLRDGGRDGHTIDMSMIERIEVLHGASAIHGLGATGGIINFITKRPDSNEVKQHAGVQITSPTNNSDSDALSYKGNYHISGAHEKWEYLLGASYENQGVFLDSDGTEIGIDNTQGDIMNSKSYDLLAKLGYWFDDHQNLEFSVNRYNLEGQHDYVAVTGDRENGVPTTSIRGTQVGIAPHNRVLTTSLQYRNDNFWGMDLNIQAYRQEFEALYGATNSGTFQDINLAPIDTLYDQSQNESTKNGAKLTLSKHDLLDNHLKLTGGLDYIEDSTEQSLVLTNRSWVPETTFKNLAPFLQAEVTPWEFLILHAGVRHEIAKLEVDDFTTLPTYNGGQQVQGGKPDYEETLYNAGFVVKPTQWLSLFANYSEGFGMPDVGRVLRAIDQPDQNVDDFLNLQPVLTENREVGFRVNMQPVDFELSYYESDSDLGSRLEFNNGVYETRREKTEISGWEAKLGYQVMNNHRLTLSYARIEGEFDSDQDGNVDSKLDGANIPPNRIIAAWNANWTPKLSSYLQVNHAYDRSFDEPEFEFDGYTLVDAAFGYKLPKGQVQLAFANLLNEDYFLYFSQSARNDSNQYYKGRGRTMTLGYSLDF